MKRQWEDEELIEHWILGLWDLAQVGNKSGATRLGFAVLFKFFQREGRFPFFKNEISGVVISFVATQVNVAPELCLQYTWTGRTIEYHRALIRKALGFKEPTGCVYDFPTSSEGWFLNIVDSEKKRQYTLG